MQFKTLLAGSAAAAAAALLAGGANAAQIDLSSYVNANLSTYFDGFVYPADGGPQTIGGVTFNLAAYPGGGTGIVQAADGNPDTYTITVGQADVTTVYTIANSAFGVLGGTIGSLTFNGSGGATYTYDYTEGTTIRDHATTSFNDVATDLFATKDYGDGDHLDVQKIVLPGAFASQTLTSITFNAFNSADGDPFIAAIDTFSGTVPEPASWALMILGLAGVGFALRRDSLARRPAPAPARRNR
jgi:PEP-CTERM motif